MFHFMLDCNNYFKKSLFIVGEIGGNDIMKHMVKYKTVTELREIVPFMVEAITNTTNVCFIPIKYWNDYFTEL